MAHFAEVDENNVVIRVCVVDNNNAPGNFPESEIIGQQYLAECGFTGRWLQTSYNNNFRKQYAGIGFIYEPDTDVFYNPVGPYPSWILDSNFDWIPPVEKPSTGEWYWDEPKQAWIEIIEVT